MISLKSYSVKTHQGPYLNINEDGHEVDIDNRLFNIFDGFGGSQIGNRYVSLIKNSLRDFYTKFGKDPDSTFPFFYSPKYLLEGNALINCMYSSHNLLLKENSLKKVSQRGGASAIGSVLIENILFLTSTGNCISYLYRKGNLEVLTYPDCLRSFVEGGSDVHLHTSPLSGLGLFDDLHLQNREIRIFNDDIIAFMTDGVYSRLTKRDIKHVLAKNDISDYEKIDLFFEMSNMRGNLDNQTVLLLQF